MLDSAPVGEQLDRAMSSPHVEAVALVTAKGNVLESRENSSMKSDPGASSWGASAKLQTRILGLYAASTFQEVLPPAEWIGLDTGKGRLAVASVKKLLVLVVSPKNEPWGIVHQHCKNLAAALAPVVGDFDPDD